MPFIKPILALCSDRTRLAKENPKISSPDFWMPIVAAKTENLCTVSFDYFINWQNRRLDRDFWLKCPISASVIPNWKDLEDDEISTLLRQHEPFRALVSFSGANNASASAIIFDDSQNWSSSDSKLIVAHWPRDESTGKGLTISRIHLENIKDAIRSKSGGPIEIGQKGLIYGTSRLECFLSTTNSLWPGDADLVICEKISMRPLALIEFKKHTEKSSIKFQDQRLSNYYPSPDRRKYDRLSLLSEQISPASKVKLFTAYYSTNPLELQIKIEEIIGTSGALTSGREAQVSIQPSNQEAGYRSVLENILNFTA